MHEMSIAEGILDIALTYARENDAARITKIGLIVGEMAGVEVSSLAFCWESLAKGSVAEGADLAVERRPITARCLECGREGAVERYNFICPDCGGVLTLLSGRELRVAYLEMDERGSTGHEGHLGGERQNRGGGT